ncbi:MAG: hypothetical protein ABL962_20080 [Fimbriimonadaceae bacterium]
MARIARDSPTGRFTIRSESGSKRSVIRDKKTGKTLPLKGYGALKDEFVVRKGLNITKPIAEQVSKKKSWNNRSTRSVLLGKSRKG